MPSWDSYLLLLKGIADVTNKTVLLAAGQATVCMRQGENEGANTICFVTIVSK